MSILLEHYTHPRRQSVVHIWEVNYFVSSRLPWEFDCNHIDDHHTKLAYGGFSVIYSGFGVTELSLHTSRERLDNEKPLIKIMILTLHFVPDWIKSIALSSYHIIIISLQGVVTLLGFCRRHGVHYRLLSTCVGSFTCPDIDAQVQGTTVFSLIRQTLFVFTSFCMCPGRDRTRSLTLLGL
jgi:hypothetical protein